MYGASFSKEIAMHAKPRHRDDAREVTGGKQKNDPNQRPVSRLVPDENTRRNLANKRMEFGRKVKYDRLAATARIQGYIDYSGSRMALAGAVGEFLLDSARLERRSRANCGGLMSNVSIDASQMVFRDIGDFPLARGERLARSD
jgi:hypothetical protein